MNESPSLSEISDGMTEYIGHLPALGLPDDAMDAAATSSSSTEEGRAYDFMAANRDAQQLLNADAVTQYDSNASDTEWLGLVAWLLFRDLTDDANEAAEVVEFVAPFLLGARRTGMSAASAAALTIKRIDEDLSQGAA